MLAVAELGHDALERGGGELAMRFHNARLGDDLAQALADLRHVLEPWDDAEDLATPEPFPLDRLAQHDAVPGHDEGADGEAIDRRGGNHRHLAHAGQRQLQGARDRRGGQGQHMDIGLQRLQPFLVGDAEMLLLVDDDEAEIAELDALRQQRMGADDDVDAAIGEPGLDRGGLLGGDHARELGHGDGEALEARAEDPVMLAGEQRRGHDDGDLRAGHRDREGGAQRDLGLAEADIAADEPVHRAAGGEVLQHVGDGADLVIGLDEGEAGAELVEGALGRDRDLALLHAAFGGDADELRRHVLDTLLGLGLAALPGAAAELVERDPLALRAEARQHLDILDGEEQLVVAGIDELQAVMRRVVDADGLEPGIAADAVLLVHDEVALLDAGGIGDELCGVAAAARRAGDALAEQVLLGDDRKPEAETPRCGRGDEAALEAEDGECDRALRQRRELADIGDRLRHDAMLAQQIAEPVAGAARPGGDHRLAALLDHGLGVLAIGLEDIAAGVAHLGEESPGAAAGLDAVAAIGLGEGRETEDRVAVQHPVPGGARQIQRARRRRAIGHLALRGADGHTAGLVVVLDHLEAGGERILGLVIEADGGALGVVEQRLHRLVEQPGPVFEPRVAMAGADRDIERVLGRGIAEELAVGGAEAGDRGLVEEDLADRAQRQRLQRLATALRAGVEAAQALDLVAEEVEADGVRFTRRVEVDDAAAHGVFARLHDGTGAVVAIGFEEARQRLGRDLAAPGQRHGRAREDRARRHLLHERVHRGQQDAWPRGGFQQPGQRRDPLGHHLGVGRDAVIGQAVPGREDQHLDIGGEEAERIRQPRHPGAVAADVDDRRIGLGAAAGQQQRVEAFRRAMDGEARHGSRRASGRPAPGLPHSSTMRSSMGDRSSSGIGWRPVSHSVRSTSGSSSTLAKASSSAASKPARWRSAKLPIIRSASFVPRWRARKSNRRRGGSRSERSGGMVSGLREAGI